MHVVKEQIIDQLSTLFWPFRGPEIGDNLRYVCSETKQTCGSRSQIPLSGRSSALALGQSLDAPSKLRGNSLPGEREKPGVSGTITEIVYIGTDIRYLLKIATGQKIQIRIQNSSKEDINAFPEGAEVQISWTPEDAKLLADKFRLETIEKQGKELWDAIKVCPWEKTNVGQEHRTPQKKYGRNDESRKPGNCWDQ